MSSLRLGSAEGIERTAGAALPGSVAARQELLVALVCPACARPLAITSTRGGGATADLHCPSCDRRWPIRQRTPNFNPERREWIPSGPVALLRAPDVERWEGLRWSVQQADAGLYAEVFDARSDAWVAGLPLPEDAQALVLGCNWGRLSASLARVCARVYAVDPDNLRARFVNARAFAEGYENLLALTATGSALPFTGANFHVVAVEDPAAMAQDTNPRRALPDLVHSRGLLASGGMLLLRYGREAKTLGRMWERWRWTRLLREAGFAHIADAPGRPRPDAGWTVEACTGPNDVPVALASYLRDSGEKIPLSERWQALKEALRHPPKRLASPRWLMATLDTR